MEEYKFPSTDKEKEDWKTNVNAAISSRALEWTKAPDQGSDCWLLSGKCPRCGDQMSQLFDFGGVIIPDLFGPRVRLRKPKIDSPEIEVVCNCSGEHKKDVEGCGFGKGVKVAVIWPPR